MFTYFCSKFIQEIVYQISSESLEFCRRYYKKTFWSLFFWTHCIIGNRLCHTKHCMQFCLCTSICYCLSVTLWPVSEQIQMFWMLLSASPLSVTKEFGCPFPKIKVLSLRTFATLWNIRRFIGVSSHNQVNEVMTSSARLDLQHFIAAYKTFVINRHGINFEKFVNVGIVVRFLYDSWASCNFIDIWLEFMNQRLKKRVFQISCRKHETKNIADWESDRSRLHASATVRLI